VLQGAQRPHRTQFNSRAARFLPEPVSPIGTIVIGGDVGSSVRRRWRELGTVAVASGAVGGAGLGTAVVASGAAGGDGRGAGDDRRD